MRKAFLFSLVILSFASLQAQDGYPIRDIFFGTRAINAMTTTQVGKKVLSYRISHRFGLISTGIRNFIGFDNGANVTFAFDYGITDDLMVGVARDNRNGQPFSDKTYSGFLKYNILNQTTDNSMPLTLAVYTRANLSSVPDAIGPVQYLDPFANRMSYTTQLLIARRFKDRFSIQIAPTFIHHNLVRRTDDANSIFAISGAAQYRISKRLGVTGEYNYVFSQNALTSDDPQALSPVSSASIGLDIVTGGHVFQVVLTNSAPINEAFAVPYTLFNWLDGDIRIGFNISRKFWL